MNWKEFFKPAWQKILIAAAIMLFVPFLVHYEYAQRPPILDEGGRPAGLGCVGCCGFVKTASVNLISVIFFKTSIGACHNPPASPETGFFELFDFPILILGIAFSWALAHIIFQNIKPHFSKPEKRC